MIEQNDKKQRHGLLINITGNGKGKTTSALGTCMRALGWGWQVSVIQFIKKPVETGEKRFVDSSSVKLNMIQAGLGMTYNSQHKEEQHVQAALNGWEKTCICLFGGTADLLVLDEFNTVLSAGWIDCDTVINELSKRPEWMHVIITGRAAPDQLIKASDLVSEIRDIKHPYNAGIKAQKGIDY
jgi:cob(I)alamin adenosyltransferase